MWFSCDADDHQTKAFMVDSRLACQSLVYSSSIPLITAGNGDAAHLGSGMLLRIKDKHFLLTVAHVFDTAKAAGFRVLLPLNDGSEPSVDVYEINLRTSVTNDPGHRRDDLYDIAIGELSNAQAARIGRHWRFLTLGELDPFDRQHRESWYLVFGYPEEVNLFDQETASFPGNIVACGTFLYRGNRGPLARYDRFANIAVDFDARTMLADSGAPARLPYAAGMSGCGIFRIAEAGCSMDLWRPEDLRLVAIDNMLDEDTLTLRATRIRNYLQLIYWGHPDLQDVMVAAHGERARDY